MLHRWNVPLSRKSGSVTSSTLTSHYIFGTQETYNVCFCCIGQRRRVQSLHLESETGHQRGGERWRTYLLGALSVYHGRRRWGAQQGVIRAEKLAGLQRWGMVCHASLIHTTEQELLEHRYTG